MTTERPREHEGPGSGTSGAAPDSGGGRQELRPLPLDLVSPQFTLRAVLTGMVLAAVLSACNIYVGLLIGWSLNMSITAALLGYGFWMSLHRLSRGRVRMLGILENNVNQTACSSGASVSSAGLVAPIPALALLTGTELDWHYLALWVLSVTLVGITVAIALRRQMLLVDKLAFPMGIASAETLREIYAKGAQAIARVKMLVGSGVVASAVKLVVSSSAALFGSEITRMGLHFWLKWIGGVRWFTAKSLTLALDPSLLMVGIGGLIGFRAGAALLLGAILAYGLLAPPLIESNYMRLTVREPLPVLPSEVVLPPRPAGYARYDENKRRLEWLGIMSVAEREELLGRSAAPRYQEAVHKLYLRSQLEPAAAAAVYTTTRELQISEPLERLPKGFTIPRRQRGVIRYDRQPGRLVAIGPLRAEYRAELVRQADQLTYEHPEQAPELAAFREVVNKLYNRSSGSFLPAGVTIPAALVDLVVFDRATQTLQVRGALSGEQAAELRDLSDDPDYRAAVEGLIGGAQLVGVDANYRDMLQWLLWPGVTLMVISALVSFAFSWRSIIAVIPGLGPKSEAAPTPQQMAEVSRKWFVIALVGALVFSVVLQVSFFQILWWAAIVGVLLAFVLAIVAARVSGETGITPVGAMGKVTQLVFGMLVPKSPAANLMAANVSGGAASQCADLLHDLKCGYLLGASPKLQALAQVCGALAGAMMGSLVYLVLIPNPGEMLLTPEWPAPAVAAWKLVAELFQVGLEAMPEGTGYAMAVAAVVGVILPILDRALPKRARAWVPSAASLGLGFVIPGWNSISMFIGGLAALCLGKWCNTWSKRFLVAVCAGIVAGDSLTGVGMALWKIATA